VVPDPHDRERASIEVDASERSQDVRQIVVADIVRDRQDEARCLRGCKQGEPGITP